MQPLVIIGGGIHGVTIFLNLPPNLQKHTLIIDRYHTPLYSFFNKCQSTGTKFLRSPVSHHMQEPLSGKLYQFAQDYFNNYESELLGKYFAPSVKLFKSYTSSLLSPLERRNFSQDEVKDLIYLPETTSWKIIRKNNPPIQTQNIILALGMGEPTIPSNFSHIIPYEKHILHSQYKPIDNTKRRIGVIGGGMSGVQSALQFSQNHEVTLITHKKFLVSHFDSDPCFIGPKCRNTFANADKHTKLDLLKQARYPGTITPYVYEQLRASYQNKKLAIKTVNSMAIEPHKNSYIITIDDTNSFIVDDVVLATGYNNAHNIPRIPLISEIRNKYHLPISKEGYPILKNSQLEWFNNLYLAGYLASLELGPPAGNIIGAHMFCRAMENIWDTW